MLREFVRRRTQQKKKRKDGIYSKDPPNKAGRSETSSGHEEREEGHAKQGFLRGSKDICCCSLHCHARYSRWREQD